MILLDTNVVSEPLKTADDAKVLAWIDAQIIETLFSLAIGLTELGFGMAELPEGTRSNTLHFGLKQRVIRLLAGRILKFKGGTQSNSTLRACPPGPGIAHVGVVLHEIVYEWPIHCAPLS